MPGPIIPAPKIQTNSDDSLLQTLYNRARKALGAEDPNQIMLFPATTVGKNAIPLANEAEYMKQVVKSTFPDVDNVILRGALRREDPMLNPIIHSVMNSPTFRTMMGKFEASPESLYNLVDDFTPEKANHFVTLLSNLFAVGDK